MSLRVRPCWRCSAARCSRPAFVFAQIAFEVGTIVAVVPATLLALSTGAAAGAMIAHYSSMLSDRIRLRDTFGRFVPGPVIEEALEAVGDDLRLNGARREATVLFSDLRGFTLPAESLTLEQVIDVLNHYLTEEMSEAIMGHGGTLVAYMGDGSWRSSALHWSSRITPRERSRRRAR